MLLCSSICTSSHFMLCCFLRTCCPLTWYSWWCSYSSGLAQLLVHIDFSRIEPTAPNQAWSFSCCFYKQWAVRNQLSDGCEIIEFTTNSQTQTLTHITQSVGFSSPIWAGWCAKSTLMSLSMARRLTWATWKMIKCWGFKSSKMRRTIISILQNYLHHLCSKNLLASCLNINVCYSDNDSLLFGRRCFPCLKFECLTIHVRIAYGLACQLRSTLMGNETIWQVSLTTNDHQLTLSTLMFCLRFFIVFIRAMSASDTFLVSTFALGEGWHNYHVRFFSFQAPEAFLTSLVFNFSIVSRKFSSFLKTGFQWIKFPIY